MLLLPVSLSNMQGFLVEDKLQQLLAPLDPAEQRMIRIDAIFKVSVALSALFSSIYIHTDRRLVSRAKKICAGSQAISSASPPMVRSAMKSSSSISMSN